MISGTVFDIQHFCVDDGPGIRTTVFLKGCPLRCAWCHNPEGLNKQIQNSYMKDKCVGCGKCMEVCPRGCHQVDDAQHRFLRDNCIFCEQCVDKCPQEALRIIGKQMSVEEVIEEVLKDKPFYNTSDGGITLSGGEPFFQSEFAIALLKAAKDAGLHTCVETSGFCSESIMKEAAQYVDIFLIDIKETDAELHKKFTGADNGPILRNLRLLSDMEKNLILHCPVVPEYNEREEHFIKIAQLANELKGVLEIHLEPYHSLGIDKYYNLDMEPECRNRDFMEVEKVREYIELMRQYTNTAVKLS